MASSAAFGFAHIFKHHPSSPPPSSPLSPVDYVMESLTTSRSSPAPRITIKEEQFGLSPEQDDLLNECTDIVSVMGGIPSTEENFTAAAIKEAESTLEISTSTQSLVGSNHDLVSILEDMNPDPFSSLLPDSVLGQYL